MNDTRDFIVERAFCLFLQRGYEGISIRDIQEAVGLSKGAIYHYFRSKEDIFGEAMDRYLLPAIQTLPEALDPESATPLRDAMDASLEWRDAYIARLRLITEQKGDDFRFFRLLFQVGEYYRDFHDKLVAGLATERERWRRALTLAVDRGEIRGNTDQELTLTLLMAVPVGLGLKAAVYTGLSIAVLRDVYERLYRTLV
ncbi:MAG: hypothetical protein AL399_00700 [Candidatus [Bacteroides] periocalifornicus]|jgi:hypothetical protein|uniref:HTH tetR-type domain-containing protein n=1 Tax=Candidatus [Bacteroides] periocalifornicus TaxID=1702214 RepID=A0A0Q4B2U5_9BACT|nr:MAG: hypothetical protein AL399_00700 [Candidatus [Bacteroides] periocalifornicus]